MLLRISTTHRPATDLGYLLHKHPGKVQEFKLAFGQAHVFYPKVSESESTVALLLDLDPVSLVRGIRGGADTPLSQYVNDKPYICSSFMSVAISQVFGSALSGRCKDKPDLVNEAIPLKAQLTSLPVRGGEKFLKTLFEPLNYKIQYERFLLDEKYEDWGQSIYYNVQLEKTCTLQELLSQLYVLIPVLDREKHYWVSKDEIEKLIDKGKDWLPKHPARNDIVNRYLKYQKRLAKEAIAIMDEDSQQNQEEADAKNEEAEEKLEAKVNLNEQRMNLVVQKLKENGATSVIDMGCGEGKLLKRLMNEKQFYKLIGVDVSLGSLNIAEDRLRFATLPPKVRAKINLIHSSLMYRDSRFEGVDAACCIEVIEHLELYRLKVFERVLFEFAAPNSIILTTPNSEYNILFENLPEGKLRHNDHRFEWNRKEFSDWATLMAQTFKYNVEFFPVGKKHPKHGAPTQMAVFNKQESGESRGEE